MIPLFSLIIIFVSLITLFPVFNVGLYGDDWLAIFRYVVPPSKEGWNLFTYYLTPYGSQDIIMGLLYRTFGTNAFYYEITSYIFRLLAAFSLYPLVFYLTKSKFAIFFAILFFSVTTIGFDSTGWLLTIPTYLTIAFFNIFLYFYIISHETKKIGTLLFSGLFFYLAYVTASQRMIGTPLFILSLEIFWLFQERTFNNLKRTLLRIAFIFAILIVIAKFGQSLGNSGDWFSRLNSSIIIIQNLLQEGHTEFFLYPIVTIGGMFIPNFAFPSIQINTKSDMLFSVALPALTLFTVLLLIIKTNINKFTRKDICKSIIAAVTWIFFVFLVRKLNIVNFSSSNLILMAVIGGLAIIMWVLLAIKYSKQRILLTGLFLSFSWTICSFFIAWLWNPASYIDSTHRYLTTSAVGVSIFFAIIISLGKRPKNQLYLGLLLSSFLILHITSTRTYINQILYSHNQQTVDKIWSSIPYISEVGEEPLVFYFEKGDNSNSSILGNTILFGFPFHIALLYNLTVTDKVPTVIENWTDVVSAVKDGQFSIDHVYAFHLQGSDNLMNITDIVRKKLAE